MKWKQIPLGPLQTNCYLLIKDQTCLIADPGAEGEKLINIIYQEGLKPQAILLTHAHFDHIGAVDVIREAFQVNVYVHEKEAEWLINPALNGSQYFQMGTITARTADYYFTEEKDMEIGDFSFSVKCTPGHSPGGVSFYFQEGIVVSGDALFNGSIGRTDLPGGNTKQLLTSIHKRLLSLPEETFVLPGHGPTTTIAEEMDNNPFLHGFPE
ncbi:MBL fold metallo-hydrolase [Bacillaceae bacterium Marseille-Q3522]|nr:MBL fold metallo-hydrolase [Bacillaceae bacterium Marseille-Q3522]